MGIDENQIVNKSLKKAYYIVFIGLLLLMTLSVFSNSDIRGVESNVIYTIQQILVDNSLLYQDPNKLPYAITQYSPLYYLICDGVLSVLGVDSANVLIIRIISRCISIIFSIGSLILFFRILTQQFKCSYKVGYFFSSLLIAFMYPWNTLSRPDGLVIFFVLYAFYLLFHFINTKRFYFVLLVGICSFFAIASKQNGALLPLIIGVFFLINKNWKAILFLILGFGMALIFICIVFLLGNYDLTFLKDNIVGGVNNGVDVFYAFRLPYRHFIIYFGLFTIGFYFILKQKFKDWISTKFSISFLLLLALALQFLCSAILAMKVGSGVNYFNEVLIIMLLALAYDFSLMKNNSFYNRKMVFGFLMIIGIQVCIVHCFYYSIKISKGIFEEYISTDTSRQEIVDFLDKNLHSDYFFSDDRKINLAKHEKCLLPQLEIHQVSHKNDVYNYTELRNNFKNGKIKYLILYSEIKPILNIDVTSIYEFDNKIGSLYIYRHKGL